MAGREVTGPIAMVSLAVIAALSSGVIAASADDSTGRVCEPVLGPSQTVMLGEPARFTWTCSGGSISGSGFFVVFIRPSGTYALLRVPKGRTWYEFSPDSVGVWRWIVINTDPDRGRPDVESEKGYFQVIAGE